MAEPLQVLIVTAEKDTAPLLGELEQGKPRLAFEVVGSAEAMAEALGRRCWDAVVVDFETCGLDAREAVEMLRARILDMPLIGLVAAGDRRGVLACLEAGAQNCLMKDRLYRLSRSIRTELGHAAARREHAKTLADLQRRIEFEKLISSISAHFIDVRPEEIDEGIRHGLRLLGEFAGVDRSYIMLFSADGKTFSRTDEWCVPGIKPEIQDLRNRPLDAFPWLMRQLRRTGVIHAPSVQDLPDEAGEDKRYLIRHSVRSLAVVPMVRSGEIVGCLGFETHGVEKAWSEDDLAHLRVLGQIFISALDHKSAQEALERSEERYRSLFEESPVAFWEEDLSGVRAYVDRLRASGVSDLRGYFRTHPDEVDRMAAMVKVLDVNRAALRLYKAGSKDELLAGLPAVLPEESRVVFGEGIAALAEGTTEFQAEGVNRTLAGETLHIVLAWSLPEGAEETWSRVVLSVVDLTERKQAQDVLRRSEERYRLLLESITDIVFVLDRDLRYVLANDAAARRGGMTRDELVGRRLDDVFHGAERSPFLAMFREVLTTGRTGTVVGRTVSPEAGGCWVEARGYPVPEGVLVVAVDITERMQAEEALRTSEEKYRLLVESAGDPIFVLDHEGVFRTMNRKAAEYFRGVPSDFVGKTMWDLFPKEIADAQVRNVRRAMDSGGGGNSENLSIIGGERRWFNTNIQPMRNAAGEITGALVITRDVTERRRQLETQARLTAIIETTTDAVATIDLEGRYIYANRAGRRLLGVGEEEDVTAFTAFDFLPQRLHGFIRDEAIPLTLRDGTWRGEIELLSRDGREIPVSLSGVAHATPDGKAEVISVIVRDVTERRRAEQALRASEVRYRSLFEDAPIPLWEEDLSAIKGRLDALRASGVTDLDRHFDENPDYFAELVRLARIVDVNRATVQLHDARDKQELLGSPEHIFTEDTVSAFRQALVGMLAGKRVVEVETTDRRLSGGRNNVIVRWSVTPGHESTLSRVLGSVVDITERKRAEAALRASESRYRQLFEESPVPLEEEDCSELKRQLDLLRASGVTDFREYFTRRPEEIDRCVSTVRMIDVNRATVELYGAANKEEIVKAFPRVFAPESRAWLAGTLAAMAEGKTRLEIEGVNRTFAGERKDLVIRWSAVSGSEDTLARVLVSLEDLTERKRAEEALRRSEEHIRRADKVDAVGRLAGGVAHDFNNLMTAVMSSAESLLAGLPAADPLREEAEVIRQAGVRASAMTRRLLAFSRQQVMGSRVIDLNAVVADACRILRPAARHDVRFVWVPVPSLGLVKADPDQVEQAVVNLVMNAFDAMPRGGTVTVEVSNVELNEDDLTEGPELRPGRYVVLAVTDTGVGMDAATRARIFEPFFTTKEVGRGTGLGLASVYGIVKQSGGDISVVSEPGRGSTFRIYLPRVEGQADAPRAVEPPSGPAQGTETVLVVEDEELVRSRLCKVMRERGYTVLEARSGAEALHVARQHPGLIHLLVTDLIMPQMNGRELASELAPLRPEMKVLFVSGYSSTVLEQDGEMKPGTWFLQKPFGGEALARKLREVLDAPTSPPGDALGQGI